jgi:GTP-binding protein Era
MTELSPVNKKKSGMVVLLGRPNVGKSTLLNSVLQEDISIVTPKAQTTRDQIRGIVNEKRGQIVFVDTPGVHRAKEGGINEFMIQEVRRALDGPDLILYMIDPGSKVSAESLILDYLKSADSKLLIEINKADLMRNEPQMFEWIAPWIEEVKLALIGTKCQFLRSIEVSAIKNKGTHDLLDEIYEHLPIGPALYDDEDSLTDRPLKFVVAELIRKQLFMKLGDEVPYSCAVEIESFKENQKPIAIQAMIYVERESQKGMVIGAGGKKIKEIGTSARYEIEKLVGEKVFLELRVKVLEAWTSEMRKMQSLGYAIERKK